MKSVTEFNENHIFNYTNITLTNINMIYLDLKMVNSTIKRILMAGGYDLSGEGSVMVISSVTLLNIIFEYFNEYSLVFYCPNGFLLVENLWMKNISNTTIFYFLVTIPGGRLSLRNIFADFEKNSLSRFIRLSIEKYESAIIEKLHLLLNEFKSNSLMMINNPTKFNMKSSFISASCSEGFLLVVKVQDPSLFLIQNCSFFADPLLKKMTSALSYESGPLSTSPDMLFGVLNCKFSYFGDSSILIKRNSYLEMKNIESSFSSATTGSFIRADVNSYLYLWNFLLLNLQSTQDGGAIFGFQSNIFLRNGSISRISSAQKGGLLSVFGCFVEMNNLKAEYVSAQKGAFIDAELTNIKLIACEIKFSISSKIGGVFVFKEVNFYALCLNISNAQATNRGGVLHSENSLINFYNSTFLSNTAALGGCFFVNSGIINIITANFEENNSTSGTILSSYDSTFILRDSNIIKNFASSRSLIEATNSYNPNSVSILINSNFTANYINEGGYFFLEKCDTQLVGIDIENGLSPITYMAFISSSVLVFKNSRFESSHVGFSNLSTQNKYLFSGKSSSFYLASSQFLCEYQIGGLECRYCSMLLLKKILLKSGMSIKGAGLRLEKNFFILFDQVNFTDSFTFESACLHFENTMVVYIYYCIFSGNRNLNTEMPTDIYFSSVSNSSPLLTSTLYMISVDFENFENLLVSARFVAAFFDDLNVVGSKQRPSNFLSCQMCKDLTFLRSKFSRLIKKGVISVFTTEQAPIYKVTILFSIFTFCSNEKAGGALSIMGGILLNITNSHFSWISTNISGGAIFFVSETANDNASFFINNSSFTSCYASIKGGAIYSSLPLIYLDKLSVLFDNNSSPLGPDIASIPFKIDLSLIDGESKVLDHLALKPGQPISFNISIKDQFGNTLTDFDDCSLKISLEKPHDFVISIINNVQVLRQGRGTLKDFVITADQIYSDFNIKASVTESKYENLSATIRVSLKSCEQGDIFFENKCKRCPENFYSLSVDPISEKIDSCAECPKNAECPGGNNLIPRPGFWRSENHSIIVKCYSSHVCPQNQNNFEFNSQCGVGHKGNLCKSCEEDFTNVYGVCERCLKSHSFWAFLLSSIFIFLFFMIFTKRTILYSFDDAESKDLQIITKLLVNHVSYFTALENVFDFSIVEGIFIVLHSAINYSTPTAQMFSSLDCILSGGFNTMSFEFFIFLGFSPVILFILSQSTEIILRKFFFTFVQYVPCCKRFKKSDQAARRVSFQIDSLIGLGVSVMIVYSALMFKFIDVFRCDELIPGVTYMKISPDRVCWEAQHQKFILLSSLFLFLWGVGFPTFLFILSKKYKNQNNHLKVNKVALNFISQKKNIHDIAFAQKPSSRSPSVKRKKKERNLPAKNFLLKGYKRKFYYWESVVYYRKLFIAFVSLSGEFLGSIALSTLFMLVFFLMFFTNEIAQIYKNPALSKFEGMSFLIILFSIALARIASMKELYLNTKLGCLISMALLNIIFFITWIKYYYISTRRMLLEKKSVARNLNLLTRIILLIYKRIFS